MHNLTVTVETDGPSDIVDITDDVRATLPSGIESGLCTIFVNHTTAGVVINEAESRLLSDIESILRTLVPSDGTYAHDAIDDNAAAHLRSMLLGASVTVPIEDGDFALGTWQSMLLIDQDGPRTRTISIHVVTETVKS